MLDRGSRGESADRASLGPRGYLVILTAGPGEVVRAEPFEATELRISVLFGIEDEEEYSRELAIVPSFELVEFAD